MIVGLQDNYFVCVQPERSITILAMPHSQKRSFSRLKVQVQLVDMQLVLGAAVERRHHQHAGRLLMRSLCPPPFCFRCTYMWYCLSLGFCRNDMCGAAECMMLTLCPRG